MSNDAQYYLARVARAIDRLFGPIARIRMTVLHASILALMYLMGFGVTAWMMGLSQPPQGFPIGRVIAIPAGQGLLEVGETLERERVIRSSRLFALAVRAQTGSDTVLAGDYFFEQAAPIGVIASRIANGTFGLTPTRVVVPEGVTVREIADIMAERFPGFNVDAFVSMAEPYEGYLFPDTYLFLPNVDEAQVLKEMRTNFETRIAEIADEIEASGRPLAELVIMASIIEEEAWKYDDRRIISGVLWNRIAIDMPLQVDAAFLYINGKNTYELTYDDLAHESPYNTYKHRGLPPGPITNPSLDAIQAAASPAETDYLFYLADRHGNTYFSRTYDEHRSYKAIYID